MLKRSKKDDEKRRTIKDQLDNEKIGNNLANNNSEKEDLEDTEEEPVEKPVIIKAEAYKTIILYANRYANDAIPSKIWKEIYGILIGYSDDNFVYVERAEALTYGHATDVQLDQKHYIFIDEIQQKLDQEKKGYYIIGWFHSHPGLNLFFSYIDLINQLGFQQNNPEFIGLVFDHTLLGKKKEEKIGENILTKYDTGFEIYRITDVDMNTNDPLYDANYHKVDYVVEGLNKFFFANLLSELAALVAAGKPLQSAYREESGLESKYKEPYEIESDDINKKIKQEKLNQISHEILNEIPLNDDILFNVDELFYEDYSKKKQKEVNLKESAEQSIYQGNIAFKNKDAFMGVEKYKEGINIYKKLGDNDRVLELLRNLSENCISTKHYVLANQFAEELKNLSKKYYNLFYKAESYYLIGYILLKQEGDENLEDILKKIQKGSIYYEKAEDYAGAGKSFHKIGTIYQSRLIQPFNACLFYIEAIRNHNQAILKGHPLRKSIWSKPESLALRINEIKDNIEELLPQIMSSEEKNKIKNDLNSIQYNF